MIRIGVSGSTGRMGQVLLKDLKNFNQLKLTYEFPGDGGDSNLEALCMNSDVVIDFSSPENVLSLVKVAEKYKTKLVIGTTGLSQDCIQAIGRVAKIIPIIYSANMSIGINILQIVINNFAKMLPDDFTCGVFDIHHQNKKDAPSGTALMLGETIKNNNRNVSYGSLRIGEVVGEHEIIFFSEEETIKIQHIAKSKSIFTISALQAGIWLHDQSIPGLYSMKDVIRK